MINSRYRFYINGVLVNNPTDWQEIQVLATFDNDSVQNNVSTSELTFPLESNLLIRDWVRQGLDTGVGIFEGIPFDIVVENDEDNSTVIGEYILDFQTYSEIEGKVTISFRYKNGLNQIADRLEAISFGWLESEGKITLSDYLTLPYVIVKQDNVSELLSLSILTFLMGKALADSIETLADKSANVVALILTGFTGPIASTVYAIAAFIIAAAYTAALLLALTKLFVQFFDAFIPIPRTHKVMTYRRMLEIVCEYLGYELETNIPLENYAYLPSNNTPDVYGGGGFIVLGKGTQKGIPTSGDYGYGLSDFMQLLKNMFAAKFSVVGNTLHFRNVGDDFWVRNSAFTMRNDTYIPTVEYNVEDLKANKLIKFRTDISDTWTITNFTGTNYEIITRPIVVNDEKNVLLRGLEQIELPIALGNRKDSFTAFDRLLVTVAKVVDGISRTFGGNSNYERKVRAAVNSLKVSTSNHVVPKVIYLVDGLMPQNHRELLSAKALYESYHVFNSFVENNYRGQKRTFRAVRIPFNFNDWLAVSTNSFFYNTDGKEAKITSIQWSVGADFAVVDYWVRDPYTINLTEDFVEV